MLFLAVLCLRAAPRELSPPDKVCCFNRATALIFVEPRWVVMDWVSGAMMGIGWRETRVWISEINASSHTLTGLDPENNPSGNNTTYRMPYNLQVQRVYQNENTPCIIYIICSYHDFQIYVGPSYSWSHSYPQLPASNHHRYSSCPRYPLQDYLVKSRCLHQRLEIAL